MRLYTCVCVCVCVFVHRLQVLVSVLQRVDGVMPRAAMRMCFRVHMYEYAYVCGYIYMCIFLQ